MSDVGASYTLLLRDLGRKTDAASRTGSAHAKLNALMPLVTGTTGVGTGQVNGAALAGIQANTGPGTTYTWSAWQQMAASMATDAMLATLALAIANDRDWGYQFGVGGGGAEAAIWAVPWAGSQSGSAHGRPRSLGRVMPAIASGARLSSRVFYGGAADAVSLSYQHGVVTVPVPL